MLPVESAQNLVDSDRLNATAFSQRSAESCAGSVLIGERLPLVPDRKRILSSQLTARNSLATGKDTRFRSLNVSRLCRQMRPFASAYNQIDSRGRHRVKTSQVANRVEGAIPGSTDGQHILVGESSVRILRTLTLFMPNLRVGGGAVSVTSGNKFWCSAHPVLFSRVHSQSASLDHFLPIFQCGPRAEMKGIRADRIVARVQDVMLMWNRSDFKFVGKPRCLARPMSTATFVMQVWVTFGIRDIAEPAVAIVWMKPTDSVLVQPSMQTLLIGFAPSCTASFDSATLLLRRCRTSLYSTRSNRRLRCNERTLTHHFSSIASCISLFNGCIALSRTQIRTK